MPGNCLLVISKNEGINPITIANKALDSGIIDKVIISDGSDPDVFQKLKSRQTEKIEVIFETEHVKAKELGKGVAMLNGGVAALRQGFENIGFIDGDIHNPNISEWMKYLFDPLDHKIDVVKAAFSRNPTDGQITRHVTKPYMAMFLPEAWELDQPLGGELSLKREVLEEIFSKGVTPPSGWGIDTLITMKSLMYGYTMGEVYLGKKMHGKKDLTGLRTMFVECFGEAMNMVRYFYNLPVRKKIKPIVRISSPFKNNSSFDEIYMDIKQEIVRSLRDFRQLKPLNLPNDNIFYEIKNVNTFDSFYEKTKHIDIDIWIEMLYWFAKKYSPNLMEQYYLRWKIRSLGFCLNEIKTAEQAEYTTKMQSKKASEFMIRTGERDPVNNITKKVYFYEN